jgi:protein transport protein SEC61 subunit gamma-like protein
VLGNSCRGSPFLQKKIVSPVPISDFPLPSLTHPPLCRLVKRCEKPDRKEFIKVATKTATGFLIVGAIGFVVKLVFIPINQVSMRERETHNWTPSTIMYVRQ